jgi:hypothetical protein
MDLTKQVNESYQRLYDALKEKDKDTANGERLLIFKEISTHYNSLMKGVDEKIHNCEYQGALDINDQMYNLFWVEYQGELKIHELHSSNNSKKRITSVTERMEKSVELSLELTKRLNTL